MIKLRSVFITVYMALLLIMFVTFTADIKVWLSFFVSACVLFVITIYHLYYEKNYSPFLSTYIVFNFLFFLAAPITQINSFTGVENPLFITKFPYKEDLVIYVNALITVFNSVFILSYIILKNKRLNNFTPKEESTFSIKILPFKVLIFTVLSIIFFVFSYNFISYELNRSSWVPSKYSVSVLLFWKKFIFFIPFAAVIMCFQYFKKKHKNRNNYLNIILFFTVVITLLFWFKNPLTEKRNALGPLYISLIFLFKPNILNSNVKTVCFLFFSMIILFPLMAIITHSDATLIEIYRNPYLLIEQMKGGGISNAFNTLNYDAFFNFKTAIDYVNVNGFSLGYQLLGGVFFFIPRSIWVSKPVSSGEMIGDYLVSDYGYNHTNLSCPFVSEGFLNFGIVGVVIYAIILAHILSIMITWLKGKDMLKKTMAFYFAMHLLFLLRGDFTNGFSYFIAPLLAVVYFPRVVEIIIHNALKK